MSGLCSIPGRSPIPSQAGDSDTKVSSESSSQPQERSQTPNPAEYSDIEEGNWVEFFMNMFFGESVMVDWQKDDPMSYEDLEELEEILKQEKQVRRNVMEPFYHYKAIIVSDQNYIDGSIDNVTRDLAGLPK